MERMGSEDAADEEVVRQQLNTTRATTSHTSDNGCVPKLSDHPHF